jgi:hypothetical protein
MSHLAALALTGALVMAGAGPAAAVEAAPEGEVLRVSAVAFAPCPALKGDQRTAQLRAAPKHAKWQVAQTSKTADKAARKTVRASRKASRAMALAQDRPRHSCP